MTRFTAYDALARIYDPQWRFFTKRGLPVLERLALGELAPGAAILDLCCGTGELALHLVGRGFRVTGLDGSEAMLEVARAKVPGTPFVVADARTFELAAEFDAVVSCFDSLNHVPSVEELGTVFRNVHRCLRPGGRFVFDLNLREGFLERWRGESTEINDRMALFSRSSFDEDAGLARMDLTLFEAGAECWSRHDVTLTQRCYAEREVVEALESAGFANAGVEVQPSGSKLSGRGFFFARRL